MPTNLEAVVISPAWPSEHGGYGIAVRASLLVFTRFFHRVHFVSLDAKPQPEGTSWDHDIVKWTHFPVSQRPHWFYFLTSLSKSTPAAAARYTDTNDSVQLALRHIRESAESRHASLAVIVEDILPASLFPTIRKELPDVPVAIRSHNVMSKAFAGFEKLGSLPRRRAWQMEQRKVRHLEQSVCESADRVWAISNTDCEEYQSRLGINPDGTFGVTLDAERYASVLPGDSQTVVHVGTADRRKGGGLAKFLQRGWPLVRQDVPQARLLLAGRGMERFAHTAEGVDILGFIPDDRTLLEKGAIFVNPQRIGSGVKLKSIVAMLAGKALVSTPTGIEGVVGAVGEDFVVGSDSEDIAGRIVALMKKPDHARTLGQHARATATANYSLEALEQQVCPLLEDLIRI